MLSSSFPSMLRPSKNNWREDRRKIQDSKICSPPFLPMVQFLAVAKIISLISPVGYMRDISLKSTLEGRWPSSAFHSYHVVDRSVCVEGSGGEDSPNEIKDTVVVLLRCFVSLLLTFSLLTLRNQSLNNSSPESICRCL